MHRFTFFLPALISLAACTGGPPPAAVAADHPASPEAAESAFVRPANAFVEEVAPARQSLKAPGADMAMEHGRMGEDMSGTKDMTHMKEMTDTKGVPAESSPSPSASATAVGTVTAVGKKALTISHEPIPDIGWPAMTMSFPLAKGVEAKGIAKGSRVTFTLKKTADGSYEIVAVKPAGGKGADAPQSADPHGH
jgi:Cu/Ag efflux protein CusF